MIDHVALILAGFFVVCLIVRPIFYYAKLRAMYQHRDAFVRFLNATSENPSDYQPYAELALKWKEITNLVRQADIDIVLLARAPSHSMVCTTSIMVFKDFTLNEKFQVLESIDQAIGHFAARRNESFSPIFWIESLFNWPKSLLGSLGFKSEGAFAKILQIVVLILEIAVAVLAVTNSINI